MSPEKPHRSRFAKKSLGQNFLVDQKAIAKIVSAVPEGTPLLLEIGPGRGALSTALFSRCHRFCVLEKDDLFAEKIEGTLFIHGSRNHHVFHGDALGFSWSRIWEEMEISPETPLVVVSNLPYNVATEILFHLLEISSRIPLMVLMFQKEVGMRIASPPGNRAYGTISVAAQNLYSVRVQQHLKPGAFRPAPKVDSVVLEFERLPQPRVLLGSSEERRGFSGLVKAAFGHRRKTLENSLAMELGRSGWPDAGREGIRAALEAAGIEGGRRAETLSVEDFGRLFQALGPGR
jgi:16S rRNA (adenine1518-N6/adenine1519-N6)-dimethyltransferase